MDLSGGTLTGRVRLAGWRVVRPTWLAAALQLGLVLALALVVRWPYLLDWPAFTDETREILLSVDVARGARWPWANIDAYIGPWHVYLLAGVFKLFGTSLATPRAVVLVLNVLAVGVTLFLGRRLAGSVGGLVAGTLASVSPMWVLVNSHVAWSASTTPLYALATLLAAHQALGPGATTTWRGGDGRRGAWLVLAGVLLGLAGQTHPTGLLLAPGLALAVAWGRAGGRRLLTPWPWLGLAGALLGYAPVLVYSLVIQPGASLVEAEQVKYAWGVTTDPLVYLGRAPRMWWAEWQMIAGVGQPGVLPAWSWPVVAGVTLVVLGLVSWGLWGLWRRGERLLSLALASFLLFLPTITAYTGELFAERYAAPLVGVAGVLIGVAVAPLVRRRRWMGPALALLLAVLPVTSLAAYYGRSAESPNRSVIATAELLAPARGCIVVILDRRLSHQRFEPEGILTQLRTLRMALTLVGVSQETRWVGGVATLRDVARQVEPAVVVGVLPPPLPHEPGPASRLTLLRAVADSNGARYGVYLFRAPALPIC